LTGYDNVDAVSGKPDAEVYLYDAVAGRLVCASCDPTGARPVGIFDSPSPPPLVDKFGAWKNHWIAGSLPAWYGNEERPSHQPRYLSDGGRLFFDSADALAPQDTNGIEDVYQYEPEGVGGCTSASVTLSQRSQGCVDLISSGNSAAESAFLDASESGDDVFFVTASRLVPRDYDTSYDVYDAHVCSQAAPCASSPVSPPECSSGDSCKPAPSPQPEIFGAPASATFSGAGNVAASSPGVVRRPLTAAQKLRRCLASMPRAKKNRHSWLACERRAKRRYPAKKAGKGRATNKDRRWSS
jgi:hypothetical protein